MKINRTAQTHSMLLVLSILLAGIFSHGLAISAQSISTAHPIGIKNFGKVNNNYYRGSQPLAGQFIDLKKLGIKTIIDLREDRLKDAAGWARAAGLRYINIPLTTKAPATDEQTQYFLELVNNQENWPVFVHCKGGRHRTGEMTAIYRITEDGWTANQAYEEMKKYDFEDSFFYPRSLKKYVFSYYKQFTSCSNVLPAAVGPCVRKN